MVLDVLPHPSCLFQQPLPNEEFKNLMKKKVYNYWEKVLRSEAQRLESLIYFNSSFMSLSDPHPIWRAAGHNPFKVTMATVQAKFLSGRYRCGSLTRHWTGNDGFCTMSTSCSEVLEDISHILLSCPALSKIRLGLYDYTLNYSSCLRIPMH